MRRGEQSSGSTVRWLRVRAAGSTKQRGRRARLGRAGRRRRTSCGDGAARGIVSVRLHVDLHCCCCCCWLRLSLDADRDADLTTAAQANEPLRSNCASWRAFSALFRPVLERMPLFTASTAECRAYGAVRDAVRLIARHFSAAASVFDRFRDTWHLLCTATPNNPTASKAAETTESLPAFTSLSDAPVWPLLCISRRR